MNLPYSEDLPIEKLAAVFNSTTNSYKYYWFLSILDFAKQNPVEDAPVDLLVIEMITLAWYPINYFKLSFGELDQFSISILELQNSFGYPMDIKGQELKAELIKRKNDRIIKSIITKLSRYVPYRFISPWFINETIGILDTKKNALIKALSDQSFTDESSPSIYRILDSSIEINKLWKQYLIKHLPVLRGFSYWHLVKFLQRKNPNVPGISEKLFQPETRLLKSARYFWNTYLENKRITRCIYSDEKIYIDEYSIDHFLPWSFVAHDQLWNLVPVPKKINSSKGDWLPSTQYLEKFAELQFDAFHITKDILKEKNLEDYTILYKESISDIAQIDKPKFIRILVENIKPLMQIAANMGFPTNWSWRNL
jgi:5-methylcytosine-specific restriction endonuclease McrA